MTQITNIDTLSNEQILNYLLEKRGLVIIGKVYCKGMIQELTGIGDDEVEEFMIDLDGEHNREYIEEQADEVVSEYYEAWEGADDEEEDDETIELHI